MSDDKAAQTQPVEMPENASRELNAIAERIRWKAGFAEPSTIGATVTVEQSYADATFLHKVADAIWFLKRQP